MQITMSDKDPLAVTGVLVSILMDLHGEDVSEEITKPEVVIPADIDDLAACVMDIRKQSQERKILLDDRMRGLRPEVEDISVQDEQVVLADTLSEEIQNEPVTLLLFGIKPGKLEVDI